MISMPGDRVSCGNRELSNQDNLLALLRIGMECWELTGA